MVKGITSETVAGSVSTVEPPRKAFGQYISLILGVIVLTLWLGLLAWLASTNWAYSPQEITVGSKAKANDNSFMQFVFVVLLAWWPCSAWKKILERESNSQLEYLRRHKRVAAAAGMVFTGVLCFAVTFGIQNGHDRIVTGQITKAAAELKEVAARIGGLKHRDLKTIDDYIRAYSEIESLQPDFDAKIQKYADIYRLARQWDESRGPINIQRFYKDYTTKVWQNDSDMIELLRQVSELTKHETLTVRSMAALTGPDQVQFWEARFRPLLEQEDVLREKTLVLQTKMQPPKNAKE